MGFMRPKVVTPPPPPPPPPEPDLAEAAEMAEVARSEAVQQARRRRKGGAGYQVAGLTSNQATTQKPTLLG